MVRKLHRICAEKGVEYIDAPVSKGSGADSADRGVLTVMAGGDPETLERVRPALEAIADPELIFHCGPVGAGAVCKLCNNLVSHATFGVMAESAYHWIEGRRAAGDARGGDGGGFGVQSQDTQIRVGIRPGLRPGGIRVREVGREGRTAGD